jgi:hypothetical protein
MNRGSFCSLIENGELRIENAVTFYDCPLPDLIIAVSNFFNSKQSASTEANSFSSSAPIPLSSRSQYSVSEVLRSAIPITIPDNRK